MKLSKTIVILFFILCILLSSCNCNSEKELSYAIGVCGFYAVPRSFTADLKGQETEVEQIEIDSYGRTLFKYTAKILNTASYESYYVVCQKYDTSYVYFYEDICYAVGESSSEDISNLKQTNDWDKPMANEKMSKRVNSIDAGLFINVESPISYKKAEKVCINKLGIDADSVEEFSIIDSNNTNNDLYLLKTKVNDVSKIYLVLVDTDYNVAMLEMKSELNSLTVCKKFKEENGWLYNCESEDKGR